MSLSDVAADLRREEDAYNAEFKKLRAELAAEKAAHDATRAKLAELEKRKSWPIQGELLDAKCAQLVAERDAARVEVVQHAAE